jgi:antitoxin MazE
MKSRIVQIGNSRGIRIPRQALAESGLSGDVEIHVKKDSLVIQAIATPRAGWAEAARELAQAGGGELLDEPTATEFDEDGWEW